MRKIKLTTQNRLIPTQDVSVDLESRTIEFPFSSEQPVDRWFGEEILSHEPQAPDFARLNDAAPLLFNHDMDQVIGVVEKAWMGEDRRGYAKVRFSQNQRAQEVLADIKDGILRNVSFGYRIDSLEQPDAKAERYIATKWSPLEVSIVSVPADQTVGIGRSADAIEHEVQIEIKSSGPVPALKGEKNMSEIDVKVVQSEAVRAERERIATIQALGEKFAQADLARQLIEGGKSIDEARGAFLEKLGVQKPVAQKSAEVDMTETEKKNYSLVRAINASISGKWDKAGFEREVSMEIAKRTGRETAGFFMPMNIQMDGERAAYAVGAAATGGNLVATNLLASSFIDILRNKAMVVQMGAKMISGLVGNVDIPKQATAATAYWVTEATALTESEMTFGKVSMSPKQIGARSQMSRLMLQQSTPDIEALVRNDLAQILALGIDLAAIAGTGASGQPTGILNTAGIGSVALGTNGAALTFDAMIDLETAVATANADAGSLGYMTNAKQIGVLKKIKASGSGEYIWSGTDSGMYAAAPGSVNGYAVGRSNQVPGNLTKGTGTNLSAVIFGNWNDLVIGEWGVLEILPNPYGSGYNSGSVDIRAMQTVDIAVRQAASFAAIVDAL